MAELLRMPEIAAAQTSAVLAAWPVEVTARFAAGDVLATVETDKAQVDVEAEADGVLLRILVPAGAEVPVGAPIALLGGRDEQLEDIDAALATLGVSESPSASSGGSDHRATPASSAEAPGMAPPRAGERVFASPLARRRAAAAELPIGDIVGTGPGGRILRRDVESAVAGRSAGAHQHAAGVERTSPDLEATRAEPAAGPQLGKPRDASYTDQPVSRTRRAIARRLTESKATAPHFYLRGRARVDALLQVRAELNSDPAVRVSINDFVVKAVAKAHQQVPEMNVVWTGDAIRRFASVDVAVAVATDAGLLTAVVREVNRLPISELAALTRDLSARAREGRLHQRELEGGSITVTNLGMYGVEEFAAIINPPQAAILAVGRTQEVPIVVDGRVEVGTTMQLTVSVDHRPVDGAVAARWMRALVDLLENPLRVLS